MAPVESGESVELLLALAPMGVAIVAAAAYAIRLATVGGVHEARADREAGSVLLAPRAVDAFYWALAPLVRGAVALGVSANALTASSLLFGAAAGLAVAFGRFGMATLFGLLAALVDTLDGQVARATDTTSTAGKLFDATADRYVEAALFVGIVFYVRASAPLLLLTLAALIASFLVSYVSAKIEAYPNVSVPRGAMRRGERLVLLTLGTGLVPAVARLFPSTASLVPLIVALAIIAVAGNFSAVRRLLHLARSAP
jgi:CDP-diacylglycerol--glycerol-3-phosphate 3-phosphatidyltransferase